MDYTKEIDSNVRTAVEKLTDDLKTGGWGVLSLIDIKKIMLEKLKIDYDDYIILDVCNPALAHKGLSINKQAGMILPCKIVVYSDKGKTKVSLYKPTVALSTASSLSGFDRLKALAVEAEEGLKKIVDMQ